VRRNQNACRSALTFPTLVNGGLAMSRRPGTGISCPKAAGAFSMSPCSTCQVPLRSTTRRGAAAWSPLATEASIAKHRMATQATNRHIQVDRGFRFSLGRDEARLSLDLAGVPANMVTLL